MNKKNIFLCILGVLLIGILFYSLATEFNMTSLANDSGFDTSYDSGSSSSSDSDWGGSSSSSGGMSDEEVKVFFVFVAFLLIYTVIYHTIKAKTENLTLDVNPEYKPFLDYGYQIFYNVQIAWMNFDYVSLRELVTDELYNMYYNQLQTLSIKGERNIMSDFELVGYDLVSCQTNSDGSKSVVIKLNVKFYDYIIDQNNYVVRGFFNEKVDMTYQLSFIYNEEAINSCPNCSAPLEGSKTICEHCNTHIHTTRSTMKLSNKQVLYQKR